ncbi:MAG: RNA-binding S4 domain-containing protein [Candidatus Poribacteria bacterium]|nr:RNA-binding S4 domain-containing protein [Candidatus Poribacteria bacterium]
MRLDKFLQVSRIVKRRTVSNAVCNSGKILVNGHKAKAGKELSVGDVLTVTFSEEAEQVFEIVEIPPGNVSRDQAATLYRMLD